MKTALLWLMALPLAAGAAEPPLTCPAVLDQSAVTVRAPAGWQGYSPGIMRLTGYGMMAGPPESMTYLVPAADRKAKGRAASVWKFAGGDEKWLYCTYDGSAAIQISRRVSDAATQCELSHRRNQYGSIADMQVTCK
jgi:hypothetical protein